MKNPEVRELVLELDRFDSFAEWWSYGWALTCFVAFTLGPLGAVACLAVTIYAIYEFKKYKGELIDKIDNLGCLCALSSP